nr:hypothetical protein [Tanacetum cinerariifolium]
MGRDTVQLETVVTTISQEYLLEFTLEYGISEALYLELPDLEDRIVDFPEGKNNRFFWVDERVFLTIVDWRTSAPKDRMPAENTYSPEAVIILNTHRTPIQKQPEALLCLIGLSRIYYQGDKVYPIFLHNDDRDMDLFSLIRASNPTKVKTRSRPRAAHEVPLLTVTANRVIEMEDPTTATDSSGVPSTIKRSPLGFAYENPSQQSTGPEDQEVTVPEVPPLENVATTRVAPEAGQAERVAATSPPVVKERRKRGYDGVETNVPPKVVKRDHANPRPIKSAPVDVSDPDPLCFAGPQSRPSPDVTQSSNGAVTAGNPDSENTSFASMVESPESIYRHAPEACKHLVDHIALPGYFSKLRHLHNDVFETIQCKPGTASGDGITTAVERVQARENEIKNLETLLEAKTDMKKAAKNKSAELSKELENIRALFSDLQVSNNRLSQQVSTLQEQVIGEEKLKAAFEEFKQYDDNRVEQRYTKMDARLDALSIDFNEESYLHMLTAIAGYWWMIERGLRLAVMKCGESTELRQAFAYVVSAGIAKGMSEVLKHEVEHGNAKLDLEAIEVYDSEAEAKYIAALHALKKLKYPLVDQLESLKDAPMDVIMASLHLESDTGDDAPQWIRKLRLSSS